MKYRDEAAFPVGIQCGLTKLEYFTVVALQGILANPECNGNIKEVARDAIRYAHEALYELEEKQIYDRQ